MPFKATGCGEPEALSVIDKLLVRKPEPAGVKVTAIVQDRLAPRDAGQLFVCVKLPATVIAIPEIAREDVPTFERMTLCGGLDAPTP